MLLLVSSSGLPLISRKSVAEDRSPKIFIMRVLSKILSAMCLPTVLDKVETLARTFNCRHFASLGVWRCTPCAAGGIAEMIPCLSVQK